MGFRATNLFKALVKRSQISYIGPEFFISRKLTCLPVKDLQIDQGSAKRRSVIFIEVKNLVRLL